MNHQRVARINDEIKKEVSKLIRHELKDPRIGEMTSVTKVETSNDLSTCKVFVSVLGGEKEKTAALEGLTSAAGFIRKAVADTVNLRQTPKLRFMLDDSVAQHMKIEALLRQVKSEDSAT